MLINSDTLSKENPIYMLMTIISLVGIYDIIDEMIEENVDLFTENISKKILLFSVVFLRTNSIYLSSVVSIIIILLFPKVFFGCKTGKRLKQP